MRKKKMWYPRTVVTDGAATAYFPPDAARLFFRIETEAETVRDARARNAADSDRVCAALNDLHIPELKVRTAQWTLNPQYTKPKHDDVEPPKVRAYRAVHAFTVLLTDSSAEHLSVNASRVLVAALENGVNVFEKVSYFKQDDQEIYRRTLAQAVEDALRNAHALAGAAGVKIKPQTLTNNTGPMRGFTSAVGRQTAGPVLAGDAPLVAGDLVISCMVHLVCEIVADEGS